MTAPCVVWLHASNNLSEDRCVLAGTGQPGYTPTSKRCCPHCNGTGYSIKGQAQRREDEYSAAYKYKLDDLNPDEYTPAAYPDCSCILVMSTLGGGSKLKAKRECPECGGTGFKRKSKLDETPASIPVKPIRLLVEVVPQKDERHGTGRYEFKDGSSLGLHHPHINVNPAMSVRELPETPRVSYLVGVFCDAFFEKGGKNPGDSSDCRAGIISVLKACGVEVPA